MAVGNFLRAQGPQAALSTVKEVLALNEAALSSGARSVRLRGVITDVTSRKEEIYVHDGSGCISVQVEPGGGPDFGTEVEVEGSVFLEPFFEKKRPRVKAAKVVKLGPGVLPEGLPCAVEEAAKFQRTDQWITVEGIVTQVRASMSLLTIQLVDRSASCNVLVRDWPRDAFPQNWIGGRVRVVGVNRAYLPGNNFYSVVTQSSGQVSVLTTGVPDPLDAQRFKLADLRSGEHKSDERVKLTGTLLGATTGNVYYVRGDDGTGFSFYMLHPIDEDKSGKFSTRIVMPVVQPGDVIDVVGMPSRTEPGVHLNFGVVSVVKPGPAPVAVPSDIATISTGAHVHDLVEVQGKLTSIDDVLVAPGRWRTTMRLENDGHSILAYLDATSRGALTQLMRDHLLTVRGIVTGPPHFPELRIWVRSPDDIQSMGVAKEVVTQRLWTGLGIAVAIVLLMAGWVLMLRRSREAVRAANASLEVRVAARTAELASAKDDLAKALSQERELSEMKTRFVSLVSHEFRTPLGVTMSAVEVLRNYGTQISEDKRSELHEDIFSATLQMSGLMEQVLLLGRAEAGKLAWNPSRLKLEDLCVKLIEEARQSTQDRCPVHFTAEGDFSAAMMDAALLRHIVGNLLSNAIKYSAKGSEVLFQLKQDDNHAVLMVKDSGIGIPEADQSRLFEAFYRASNIGETPGTGLGLLLVKRCVELHQGTITMESKEGAGTTFTVRLPLSTSV